MAPEGKKQRTMFGFDEPVEIGSLDLDELLKNLPEEKCKDFGKDLAPKRSEGRLSREGWDTPNWRHFSDFLILYMRR